MKANRHMISIRVFCHEDDVAEVSQILQSSLHDKLEIISVSDKYNDHIDFKGKKVRVYYKAVLREENKLS